MNTLIIGGGASGLYLGSLLSGSLVLERNDEGGRKLLMTGGGRCNYTHSGSVDDLLIHYNGNKMFVKRVLYNHTPDDITRYLESIGVRTKEEESGQRYPASDSAMDIVSALRRRCDIEKAYVTAIEHSGSHFLVHAGKGTYHADNVVLASGGNAFPRTGSDGSGFRLARSLGHKIIQPRPALSQIILPEPLAEAEGISVSVTLKTGKKEFHGDVVVTKRGLSGPAAENISRELPGEITISFLREACLSDGKKLVKNAVPLPPRLSQALLGALAEKKCGNLSSKEKALIESRLTRFKTEARPDEKSAMVTRGGVDTSGIDSSRMESKLVPGLYFTGEIVDIDAECGGYNLTWAFSSAYTVWKALRG